MKPFRYIEKNFVLQEDGSDCGVACLLSLLKYYGSDSTLEHLRKLSGTTQQGTSLLGLYEAAQKTLRTENYKALLLNPPLPTLQETKPLSFVL